MVNLKKIAVVITAGLLVTGCVSQASYRKLETKYNTDVTAMSAHIRDLGEANKAIDQGNKGLTFELQKAKLENEALKHKARVDDETLTRMKENIVRKLQGLAGIDGLIFTTDGVEIQGEVLFSPGKSELKQKGKEILAKIADIIKKESFRVQISGHTDNDPIVQTKDLYRTGSNFELAAWRALNVLLYMEDQGVDPARMFLASFGEHRPKGAKKSENRRVEISFIKAESEAKEEATPPEENTEETAPDSKEPSK
ncbi:MAG TPA: OmpA family protein [Planctomycetota bacterium]|nr:OmpA family protein [Planctomycetota bacterium]